MERAVHENLRRIEYDATHGPPGLRQFSSHLRQVVWPHNFKLEKLKKYDGKENPENWITLHEIASVQQQEMSTSWPTTSQSSLTRLVTSGS